MNIFTHAFVALITLGNISPVVAANAATAWPEVTRSLRPGLCISNHPQEKIYLESEQRLFRVKWTYQCNYYCMNRNGGIEKVAALHTDTVWLGYEDGDEFLCLGMKLKWVETAARDTNRWGYFTTTGAQAFSPLRTKSPELLEWYARH